MTELTDPQKAASRKLSLELFSMVWSREGLESSGKLVLNSSQALTSYENLLFGPVPQNNKDDITYVTKGSKPAGNSFSKSGKARLERLLTGSRQFLYRVPCIFSLTEVILVMPVFPNSLTVIEAGSESLV